MKILHIRGYDNAIIDIENEIGIKKAAKLVAKGKSLGEEIEASIIEFGPVDPKFVKFIEDNFIDYDEAKTENFYVIDE